MPLRKHYIMRLGAESDWRWNYMSLCLNNNTCLYFNPTTRYRLGKQIRFTYPNLWRLEPCTPWFSRPLCLLTRVRAKGRPIWRVNEAPSTQLWYRHCFLSAHLGKAGYWLADLYNDPFNWRSNDLGINKNLLLKSLKELPREGLGLALPVLYSHAL
jgi:hypothetical protein